MEDEVIQKTDDIDEVASNEQANDTLSIALGIREKKHCCITKTQTEVFFRRVQRVLNPINDSAIGIIFFTVILKLINNIKLVLPFSLTLTTAPILMSILNEAYFSFRLWRSKFLLGDSRYNQEAKLINGLEKSLREIPKFDYIEEIIDNFKIHQNRELQATIRYFILVNRYAFIREIMEDILSSITSIYLVSYFLGVNSSCYGDYYITNNNNNNNNNNSNSRHFSISSCGNNYIEGLFVSTCVISLIYLLKLGIDIVNSKWYKLNKKWQQLSYLSQNVLLGIKVVIINFFKFMNLFSLSLILYMVNATGHYGHGHIDEKYNNTTIYIAESYNNRDLFYLNSPLTLSTHAAFKFEIFGMHYMSLVGTMLLYFLAYCLPDYRAICNINYFRTIKKMGRSIVKAFVAFFMTYIVLMTFYYLFLVIIVPNERINLNALQNMTFSTLFFSFVNGLISAINALLNYTPPDPNKWNVTSKRKKKELITILSEKERLIEPISDDSDYDNVINEGGSSSSNEVGFWLKCSKLVGFKLKSMPRQESRLDFT